MGWLDWLTHGPDSLTRLARFLGLAISLTTAAFALAYVRALRGARDEQRREVQPLVRAVAVWFIVVGGAAALISHSGLAPIGPRILPLGGVLGFALAVASLGWAPARRAFDALSDAEVRGLFVYRAAFGGMLVAGAGFSLFPPVFAWTAGVGDLLVAWLAAVIPGSLGARGGRPGRLFVHGVSLLDLVQVVFVVLAVVRPWLLETGSPVPSLLLPWIGVPLMLALNLHGLRHALSEAGSSGRESAESLGDRSEPPRGVRGSMG